MKWSVPLLLWPQALFTLTWTYWWACIGFSPFLAVRANLLFLLKTIKQTYICERHSVFVWIQTSSLFQTGVQHDYYTSLLYSILQLLSVISHSSVLFIYAVPLFYLPNKSMWIIFYCRASRCDLCNSYNSNNSHAAFMQPRQPLQPRQLMQHLQLIQPKDQPATHATHCIGA